MPEHEHKGLFKTFLMGGFESAAPILEGGRIIDLLAASRHDRYCQRDYQLIKSTLGIRTVREGFSWCHINSVAGNYDFSRYEPMLQAGQTEGMEQIWSLCHFNYPKHIDILEPEAITAFTRYAVACFRTIRRYQQHSPLYIIPINEISFWSYMAGNAALWPPYRTTKSYVLRQQFCRMAIAAMEAIWQEDTSVRFIQPEPLFRRIPGDPITPGKKLIAELFREIKFQPYDMLLGTLDADLGGDKKYLDILGGNYYPTNQERIIYEDWLDDTVREPIRMSDKEWVPFTHFLEEAHERYHRPILITETGAAGDTRVAWFRRVLPEINAALENGIPITGVCIFPILDRHEWFPNLPVTQSGLWDFHEDDPLCDRIPFEPAIAAVREWTQKWAKYNRSD